MDKIIVVRGGGDLATGSIYCLANAGFKVLVLEAEYPAAIRRQVEDKIAELLVDACDDPPQAITLAVEDGNIVLR